MELSISLYGFTSLNVSNIAKKSDFIIIVLAPSLILFSISGYLFFATSYIEFIYLSFITSFKHSYTIFSKASIMSVGLLVTSVCNENISVSLIIYFKSSFNVYFKASIISSHFDLSNT